MKKFYALTAMLACTALVFANKPLESGRVFDTSSIVKKERPVLQANPQMVSGKTININKMMKLSRADEWTEIGQGTFEDGWVSNLNLEANIWQNADGTAIKVTDAYSIFDMDTEFIFDVSNPACVKVPPFNTGETYQFDENGEVTANLYLMSVSYYFAEYGDFTDDEIIQEMEGYEISQIEYSAEDGIIYAPEYAMFAYFPDLPNDNEYAYNDGDGWMSFWGDYSYLFFPGVTPQWSSVDQEAVWYDGIVAPMYGNDDVQGIETFVEMNNYAEGYYRIYMPWIETAGYYGAPYMIFNMSNPDCIVVPINYVLDDPEWGPTYILSFSANFIEDPTNPEDVEAFLQEYSQYNITASLDGDDTVITFPANCCLFYWPEYNENSLYISNPAEGYLIFKNNSAGIINIPTDDSNAAPVYYNIQGMKVQNPAEGQLYIVKQGNKTTKQIYR